MFDRLDRPEPEREGGLEFLMWERREIENHVCSPTTLDGYARSSGPEDAAGLLFSTAEAEHRAEVMRKCIGRIGDAMRTLGKPSPWDPHCKTSDEFLGSLFDAYFRELGLPDLMRKGGPYRLAEHVPEDEIAIEIREKLDGIACGAQSVKESAI